MGKSNSKVENDSTTEDRPIEESLDNKDNSRPARKGASNQPADENTDGEEQPNKGEKKKKKGGAKGRLYVIIRHPVVEGTKYTPQQMEGILLGLQMKFPKYEIVLDVGRMDRYSGFVTFYESEDPKKLFPKPRIIVDCLLYNIRQGCFQEMGPFPRANIDREAIKNIIRDVMDPEAICFIDFRQRPLYREQGMLSYEALLRI